MRILYVALDQRVPGTLGGSVHVQSVAEGLAALGHDVHVATQPGHCWPAGAVHWHAMGPPLGRQYLRWMRTGAVTELARRLDVDLIMERYYNFGGEGITAATHVGVPAVLEVNAPVIDYPGSLKSRVDRALLLEPMRRWRDAICRRVQLFVTTSADILPPWVERRRILEVEWGADVDHFSPDAVGPVPFTRDGDRIICIFAGAFRSWHGVVHLSAALARLHRAGDHRFGAVFIGDGPERSAARTGRARRARRHVHGRAAAHGPASRSGGSRHRRRAVRSHEARAAAPRLLLVAAEDLRVHGRGPARRGARAAPAEAAGRRRMEGVLYDPRNPRGLDRALTQLADAATRARMGAAARTRVVRDFSWRAHCAVLDRRLRAVMRGR